MTTKSLNTKKASSVKTIVFIVLGIFALIGLLVLLLIGGFIGFDRVTQTGPELSLVWTG